MLPVLLLHATSGLVMPGGVQRAPARPLLPAQRAFVARMQSGDLTVPEPAPAAAEAPKGLRSRLAAMMPPANEVKKLVCRHVSARIDTRAHACCHEE